MLFEESTHRKKNTAHLQHVRTHTCAWVAFLPSGTAAGVMEDRVDMETCLTVTQTADLSINEWTGSCSVIFMS